ncbi:MAG TPA: hypothetical protein VFW60_03460 [Rhodanobacteraceae bacterium]|nr:hypothetical protein [Rhodanobacteraceae bacterium]
MKRIALSMLLLAPVVLAGCHTIRAHSPFRHKDTVYQSARQEPPLKVPPGADQPATTEALVIPDTGSGVKPGKVDGAPPPIGLVAPTSAAAKGSSLTLSDTPANAYQRVGLALKGGGIGRVTAHDDAALTYQITVNERQHRSRRRRASSRRASNVVTVSVAPSPTGSLVSAKGNPGAVAEVMKVLQQELK